jgi:hypothetical protein
MNITVSVALVACALCLSACGGGNSPAPTPASAAPPPAAAPPADPAPPPTPAVPTPTPPAPPSSSSSGGSSSGSSSSSSSSSSGSSTSSSSSSGGPKGPATGLGGIWTSTGTDLLFTSPTTEQSLWSGPVDFYYEAFVIACGTTDVGFTGELTANGNSLSGTGDQSNNDCFAPIYTPESFQGTIVPGQSLSLTVIDSTGAQSTIDWTFDSLYLQPSSLSALAGQWVTSDSSIWSIGSAGQVDVSNLASEYAGCTVTGQISIINAQFNLYSFTLTWSYCPIGPYENGQVWTGFLALDASTSPSQLLGGGVINMVTGYAYNQSLIAVAQ